MAAARQTLGWWLQHGQQLWRLGKDEHVKRMVFPRTAVSVLVCQQWNPPQLFKQKRDFVKSVGELPDSPEGTDQAS